MQILEKKASYGIRPFLYEEETLTSYLHRVADFNYISYEDVIRQIINQTYRLHPSVLSTDKRGHIIDLLPTVNLNVGVLAGLLKNVEFQLKRHTLFNLFCKFEPEDNLELKFIKMCSNIYNIKSRVFCPICINKNKGVYKLHWQFLWNDVCEKHKCKLVNTCMHCNAVQNYIHSGIGKGLCSNCGQILVGEISQVKDKSLQTRCNAFMNDYHFLLSSTNEFLSKNCVSNREESLAITLIYAAQIIGANITKNHHNLRFNRDDILQILKKNELSGLIRIIKGLKNKRSFNLSFPLLYKLLKKMNVSFLDFSRIIVPEEFLNSLYVYASSIFIVPSEKPRCKFEFCNSYQSERMMLKQEREKIVNKEGYYFSPHICLGCFIQYGYNKKGKSWDDISNAISDVMKIRNLLNKGLSPYKISELTSTTIINIYSAIGFLLKHSLLGPKETNKYMKKVSSFDSMEKLFSEIDRRRGNRAKELIKKYQIHPINFYYHFYTVEVQKKLYDVKKDNNLKKSLVTQANLFIKKCNESGETISIMRFCKKSRVSLEELRAYDIYDTILLAKVEQKKQLTIQKEKELFNKVKDYFYQNEGRVILVKEVYNYLSYKDMHLCRYHPDVYREVSDLCTNRKKDIIKSTIEDLKVKVKQFVEGELRRSGKFPTTGNIIDELKLKKQFYRNYREVYEYTLELKKIYQFKKGYTK